MKAWFDRHWFTFLAVPATACFALIGLSDRSSIEAWIIRGTVVVGIAVLAYAACRPRIDRLDRALSGRRGGRAGFLGAALGVAAWHLGSAVIVPLAAVLLGATIAFDHAGLILGRQR